MCPSRDGEKIPRFHSQNHLCAHLTRALLTGLTLPSLEESWGRRQGLQIDDSGGRMWVPPEEKPEGWEDDVKNMTLSKRGALPWDSELRIDEPRFRD